MVNLKDIKLAEFVGVMMGDGNLSLYKSDYRVSITGHKNDDLAHFQYLQDMFIDLFNKKLKLRDKGHYILLEISNKEIFSKLHNLGIPIGKKSAIVEIPPNIFNNLTLSKSFLKGFADAEFSVTFKKAGRKKHSYPRLSVDISSKKMIEQISQILERLNISYKTYERHRKRNDKEYITYTIDINGKENLSKWVLSVGFNNQKHLEKIKTWKEKGHYIP